MGVRYTEVLFKANVQSGPGNGVRYREVPAIKCPLYRGSLKGKLIGINPFSRKVSVIERCPLYKMSAIERFHCIPKL